MTKKQRNYLFITLFLAWLLSIAYAYEDGAVSAHKGETICTYEAEWDVWDCDKVVIKN